MALTAPPTALARWLMAHPLVTWALMTVAFLVLGAVSLDLARVVSANLRFLAENGWQAVMDQALWQLLLLVLKALLATAAYVILKLCETVLVGRLAQRAG